MKITRVYTGADGESHFDEIEVEVGDGTKVRFGPGDIFLADDATGRGHISRVVGTQPRVYVTVAVK